MNGAARWLAAILAATGLLGGFALYVIRGEINQVAAGFDAEMEGIATHRASLMAEWRGRFDRMEVRLSAVERLEMDTDQNARLGSLREAFCAHLRNDHQRGCGLRGEPDGPDL